ncbi:hypothetical protein MMC17_009509, partial [Xylographa soralifera]|nr:hypothetical protein [Xylographa soralifera]
MPTLNHFAQDFSDRTSFALFGPQRTRWTRDSLTSLQITLLQNTHLKFLEETLAQLPVLWQTLGKHYKAFDLFGQERLQQISAFATGKAIPDPQNLCNIQLATLTVISHVVDIVRMTNKIDAGPNTSQVLLLPDFQAAQGFCIGFLSAAAISSSIDWAEFECNISNALRLAVCIGAVIDIDNASHDLSDRARAVSVRWKTDSDRAYMEASLDLFPSAYVSCNTEERTLTITVPSRDETSLCSQLSKVQITTKPIGLNGYFHHQRHADAVLILKKLCAEVKELQLPDAEKLRLPLRSTANTEIITTGALHDIALNLILCNPANWFQTVKATLTKLPSGTEVDFVTFGNEFFVPRSLSLSKAIVTNGISHHEEITDELTPHLASFGKSSGTEKIAVIGMACRFPQADSVDEFWQLISSGETAIGKVPIERFNPVDINREPKLENFWGNFLRNPDAFDHRFFGVSGREAKSMDPQQRLALQVAYEALESSGYFSLPSKDNATDIGCYLGVGSVDYEDNVASENANAFSALGTLRAFISGRISHFLGWTGPSIMFDTACSSSAVAIHSACKALIAKECSMALAGGVNVITSPNLYQNLSAASFLNPHGSSKAFDVSANGYCRGEGAGLLLLKPLSKAVADGDFILGVIAGSAVNQGSNCSPITVPDSQSQTTLYQKALSISGIEAKEVTYVEAHGTGTLIGDPIEYESVRVAFTGPSRSEELFLGSVKDNIGHAEGASGAAGVIKSLLMMQHKTIPKQANFVTLNPRIKCSATDRITVPKENQPWTAQMRAALVNNYGAAGSNAAIVLHEYTEDQTLNRSHTQPSLALYPILLSAKSETSLRSYVTALESCLPKAGESLSRIAFNIARRQNASFEYRAAFVASDSGALLSRLKDIAGGTADLTKCTERLPVVLCFGGQTSRNVTLSQELFHGCELLQTHLKSCDAACQALGLPSIFPGIFQEDPVEDLVSLHIMLFSLQYSAAKCWLDCGLEVDTVIGHSFGQLTALCIADSISFRDGLRLVSDRAHLVRDSWGRERGIMLSVESEREDLEAIVHLVNSRGDSKVDFSCYNGPRSFVLAGDTSSIEKVEEACRSTSATTRVKTVRLKNTHAYHSHLADGVLLGLKKIANSIEIKNPRIPVETCSSKGNWTQFTAEEIVEHTRQPVYFSDAIERIAARLPRAVWLEAGSASPIIAMTRRIAASHLKSDDIFVPMNLGASDATSNLANAACQLWTAGSSSQYWLFHRAQRTSYTNINLPPYQFEKARHWIRYEPKSVVLMRSSNGKDSDLVSLVESDSSGEALFSVDTCNAVFDLAARGHAVAGQSLCPASMYIELASRCAAATSGGILGRLPQVEELAMSAPLGLNEDIGVFLRLRESSTGGWDFVISSRYQEGDNETEHAKGRIILTPMDDPFLASRMKLLRRLARSSRADQITASSLTTGISGSMVYKIFADVVEYADYYRGVKSLSVLDNEAVGLVSIPGNQPSKMDPGICDPVSLDNFLQVAGIQINCLSNRKSDEVFMCIAIEEIVLTKSFQVNKANDRSWMVYSKCQTMSKAKIISDVFVYDSDSKDLVLAIMGASFRSVPFKSMARTLAKLNNVNTTKYSSDSGQEDSGYQTASPTPTDEECTNHSSRENTKTESFVHRPERLEAQQGNDKAKSSQLTQKVCEMFSDIMEIPFNDIKPRSKLEDLGIDSLLVTEVLREIQKLFNIVIAPAEFQEFGDIQSLCHRIQPASDDKSYPSSLKVSTVEHLKSQITDYSTHESLEKPGDENRTLNNLAVVSHDSFNKIKISYNRHAEDTGFANFCTEVHPLQSKLVAQYVVEAFASLGCDVRTMKTGDKVPIIQHISKHKKLIPQLYNILQTAGVVTKKHGGFSRTAASVPNIPASALHAAMLEKFPKHTSETKLLYTTAHRLADCLSGVIDPLSLVFRDSTARALLDDVYTNAPMFKTGTLLLAQYLSDVVASFGGSREVKIIELGAGFGGTSKFLLEKLAGSKHKFTYTFTDLSSSLVGAGKRKFAKYPFMHYAVLDVEKDQGPEFIAAYDIVISTNCIHATTNLVLSTTNIRKMLRTDGILCLVELTRNIFWFDLVFGLLEGWWLFNDGREHVLADESLWKNCLHAAGFQWIDWSNCMSKESDILRVITASPYRVIQPVDLSNHVGNAINDSLQMKETVTFKEVDGLDLNADIYYPPKAVELGKSLPVALMIHGGGHIMLSRNDIRPEQIGMLLERGFLPVSIDYRLCPETTLPDGPMADVTDALAWIRNVLPNLPLKRPDVQVNRDKVVSVGWSTGGHLAMSLAWTSPPKGIRPPDAILAFYCPTDYEDPFWTRPNRPTGSASVAANHSYYALDDDIWAALLDRPIASYNVPSTKRAVGGWLAPSDPRSRIALYMNWHGRSLNVLLHGLDKQTRQNPPIPTSAQVVAVSPLAQVRRGAYKTPTFIVHPRQDDLIPWQQAARTFQALRRSGVEAELRIVEEAKHLFDVYPGYEANEGARGAMREG